MTDYIITEKQLTDIADAIRAKTGRSATMEVDQMPGKILNIGLGESAVYGAGKGIEMNYDAEEEIERISVDTETIQSKINSSADITVQRDDSGTEFLAVNTYDTLCSKEQLAENDLPDIPTRTSVVHAAISKKQDKLTSGQGIVIDGANIIYINDTVYASIDEKQDKLKSSDSIAISEDSTISVKFGSIDEQDSKPVSGKDVYVAVNTLQQQKQDTLLAGDYVKIENNTVSIDTADSVDSDTSKPILSEAVRTALLDKQNVLTAGDGVQIHNNTIEVKCSYPLTVTEDGDIGLHMADQIAPDIDTPVAANEVYNELIKKQDKLTPGDCINIDENNVISVENVLHIGKVKSHMSSDKEDGVDVSDSITFKPPFDYWNYFANNLSKSSKMMTLSTVHNGSGLININMYQFYGCHWDHFSSSFDLHFFTFDFDEQRKREIKLTYMYSKEDLSTPQSIKVYYL